jgi:hypothetical protein
LVAAASTEDVDVAKQQDGRDNTPNCLDILCRHAHDGKRLVGLLELLGVVNVPQSHLPVAHKAVGLHLLQPKGLTAGGRTGANNCEQAGKQKPTAHPAQQAAHCT